MWIAIESNTEGTETSLPMMYLFRPTMSRLHIFIPQAYKNSTHNNEPFFFVVVILNVLNKIFCAENSYNIKNVHQA